jgi:hypothetical protein
MGARELPAAEVWKALTNPGAVARAVRGETAPTPVFPK